MDLLKLECLFFLDLSPGIEFLDHMVALFLAVVVVFFFLMKTLFLGKLLNA